MATRHQARVAAVGLLYAYDLGNEDILKFGADILEEKKIRNKQRDFAMGLFQDTIANLEDIDTRIKEVIKDWDFDRIGSIEKAVLRLGTYELLHSGLDKAVVINEALEIAKKLGNEQSPKFINGVLDALVVKK